ncbi:hypothetical protein GCM10027258_62510 [Amycolatopsis stemonae]
MKRFAVLAGALLLALLTGTAPAHAAQTITENTATVAALNDVRTAGHYEFTPGGLHVWTDDATSQAKVALYYPADLDLDDVDAGSVSWTGSTPPPGVQLVVTAGGKTGILVGESVYGDQWWMSDGYCATFGCDALTITYQTSGGGSAHSATLAQWSAGLPGAKVTAVGFSLGSGVKGDGVLRSLTVADDTYTFAKSVETPPTTTVPPTSTPPTTTPDKPAEVYYEDCAEVRAAGKAPLFSASPGYRVGLDSDGDGVACEVLTGPTHTSAAPTDVPVVTDVRQQSLASTGASVEPALLVGGGALLLLLGIGLVVLVRRRRAG